MGRLIWVLADVKFRTLISIFDVEQQRPNAMALKSTTKTKRYGIESAALPWPADKGKASCMIMTHAFNYIDE